MEEILDCLRFGKTGKQYSEKIRRVGLTLHFYSPCAYRYLRGLFKNRLPSIRTIRSWYSGINGSPGFTNEAIAALQLLATEMSEKGEKLHVCLIQDEMKIQPRSEWNHKRKEFSGFISIGGVEEYEDAMPLGTDALVFMISGINKVFKAPVAYFLTNGLNADERAALTNEIILRISAAGVKVAAITSDGLIANVSMMKRLGADFTNDKPFFIDPYDGESKIYTLLDPPHMLKLARNCIASKKLHNDEGLINWGLFQKLEELQRTKNLNLGNKLKQAHINWDANKMCVRLAAESISHSVANSMTQLHDDGHKEFHHVNATISFIRTIKNLFNSMNSKINHEGFNFKCPISESNESKIFDLYDRARIYLKTLKLEVNGELKPVLETKSYTPFFGMYYNTICFQNLYIDYVKDGPLNELYAFAFSQDHLETFFGCIRRMNGCNTNPTPVQFQAAYRKLLVFNEITNSEFSNCIQDTTGILTISSRHSKENQPPIEMLQSDKTLENRNSNEDVTRNHSDAYMASKIEVAVVKSILRRGQNKCTSCINILTENETIHDSLINMKSQNENIIQPCISTVTIVQTARNIMDTMQGISIKYCDVLNQILSAILHDNLYEISSFVDHPTDHKYELVKLIVETYLKLESSRVADNLTIATKGRLIRRVLVKQIHYAGQ